MYKVREETIDDSQKRTVLALKATVGGDIDNDTNHRFFPAHTAVTMQPFASAVFDALLQVVLFC